MLLVHNIGAIENDRSLQLHNHATILYLLSIHNNFIDLLPVECSPTIDPRVYYSLHLVPCRFLNLSVANCLNLKTSTMLFRKKCLFYDYDYNYYVVDMIRSQVE